MTLNSTITIEPNRQKVEVTTNFEGANISVQASDKKLYAAIASAAKKLQGALSKRKGVLSAKINQKFVVEQSDQFLLAS